LYFAQQLGQLNETGEASGISQRDEESRVDFRLALSGVVSLSVGRYVVETICGDSDRMNPNKHLAS
jgi:hypothetical protein